MNTNIDPGLYIKQREIFSLFAQLSKGEKSEKFI